MFEWMQDMVMFSIFVMVVKIKSYPTTIKDQIIMTMMIVLPSLYFVLSLKVWEFPEK